MSEQDRERFRRIGGYRQFDKNCPDHMEQLIAAAALTPPPAKPTDREMRMIGYSPETERLILKAIELDPALEELILDIAELAYVDGQD